MSTVEIAPTHGPLTISNRGDGLFVIANGNPSPGEYVEFRGFFGSYGPEVFAAAPELLQALQAVYENCEGYVPNTSKAVWLAASKAIAKATGSAS